MRSFKKRQISNKEIAIEAALNMVFYTVIFGGASMLWAFDKLDKFRNYNSGKPEYAKR